MKGKRGRESLGLSEKLERERLKTETDRIKLNQGERAGQSNQGKVRVGMYPVPQTEMSGKEGMVHMNEKSGRILCTLKEW